MSKADPEQFAKTVLWHLTKMQAELADARAEMDMVLSYIHPEGISVELLKQRQAMTKQQWERMYKEACRQAGLSEDLPSGTGETAGNGSQN